MSAVVINLGEKLARTVAHTAMTPLPPADCLSEKIGNLGHYLEMASLQARRAGDREGATFFWRIAQSAHDAAKSAERLERKYRKARKARKGR